MIWIDFRGAYNVCTDVVSADEESVVRLRCFCHSADIRVHRFGTLCGHQQDLEGGEGEQQHFITQFI